MPYFFLFDVDGTLIRCGVQVKHIYEEALREITGLKVPEGYDFSGKTDSQITSEILSLGEVEEDKIESLIPVIKNRYLQLLDIKLDRSSVEVLPGVYSLLDKLTIFDQVNVGLLTGNWKRGAYIKLSPFGLDSYFRWGFFGEDGYLRKHLVQKAVKYVSSQGGKVEDIVIVGDSWRDVEAAKAYGIKAVGVTTGWTSADTLLTFGADVVVESLEDKRVLDFLIR